MEVFNVKNVNEAVATVIPWLLKNGTVESSRNGRALVAPGPVCTIYQNPQERVLFSPARNANPFFHLMESLWMLAGRNDLAFPMYFNKRFAEYSDDGLYVHGAYGYRWRRSCGYDQLEIIAAELKKNPSSRRCVVQMWDGGKIPYVNMPEVYGGMDDLHLAVASGKDVPCNTHAYFDARGGVLNMTVCNRSNDAIWGAYGTNAVHFSILQEYMAAWIGIPMGVYRQISNNFHAYLDLYDEEALQKIAAESVVFNHYTPYPGGFDIAPLSLIKETETIDGFNDDLKIFFNMVDEVDTGYPTIFNTYFFQETAAPMYTAWWERKEKLDTGLVRARNIHAPDWQLACVEWIERMEAKKL